MTGRLPVLTIPVPGAPEACPSCGMVHVRWPLTAHAGRVYLTCPRCHVNIAQLAATPRRTPPRRSP